MLQKIKTGLFYTSLLMGLFALLVNQKVIELSPTCGRFFISAFVCLFLTFLTLQPISDLADGYIVFEGIKYTRTENPVKFWIGWSIHFFIGLCAFTGLISFIIWLTRYPHPPGCN